MIGKRQWYAAPDDTIETWCFLILKTVERDECEQIIGWELGFGNPVQITGIESKEVETTNKEEQVLKQLLNELNSYRYEGVVLVIPRLERIQLLRTRLLNLKDSATLRGFSALAVREVINRHFQTTAISQDFAPSTDNMENNFGRKGYEETPEELFHTIRKIGPLVPRESLSGFQL